MQSKSLLAVLVLLLIMSIYCLSINTEKYEGIQSYAYQNNIQPYYLTPQSVQLYMNPARQVCIDRVKAECSSEAVDKTGCVLNALKQCELLNRYKIKAMCESSLPATICKHTCKDSIQSNQCQGCILAAISNQICDAPGISP